VGYRWRDSNGIVWRCVSQGGVYGSAITPSATWIAEGGVVVIDIPRTSTNNNGMLLWAPQVPFLIDSVALVVTDAFTGTPTFWHVVNSPGYNNIISQAQGAKASLTLSAVIDANVNGDPSALFVPVGKKYLMPATAPGATPTSGAGFIASTDATGSSPWTTGAAKLIVRGQFLP
jgi:hypothetical protein